MNDTCAAGDGAFAGVVLLVSVAAIAELAVFFGGLIVAYAMTQLDAAVLGAARLDVRGFADAWTGFFVLFRLAGFAADRTLAGVGLPARMTAITGFSVLFGRTIRTDTGDEVSPGKYGRRVWGFLSQRNSL